MAPPFAPHRKIIIRQAILIVLKNKWTHESNQHYLILRKRILLTRGIAPESISNQRTEKNGSALYSWIRFLTPPAGAWLDSTMTRSPRLHHDSSHVILSDKANKVTSTQAKNPDENHFSRFLRNSLLRNYHHHFSRLYKGKEFFSFSRHWFQVSRGVGTFGVRLPYFYFRQVSFPIEKDHQQQNGSPPCSLVSFHPIYQFWIILQRYIVSAIVTARISRILSRVSAVVSQVWRHSCWTHLSTSSTRFRVKWCSFLSLFRPEDPHLRFGPEKGTGGGVSPLRASGVGWAGATVLGSVGGWPYLLQQVLGQDMRQGCLPHSYASSSVPRAAYQQDVVMRWSR